MIHFTDVTGLAGVALAATVVASRMPVISRLVPRYRGWMLAVVFAFMLLPLGALPLAGYLRGATGDLSITTLVLLAASLLRMQRGWPVLPGRNTMLMLIVIAAAGFYPLALGWGEYDPYRLGYGSYLLLSCLLGMALLAALGGLPAITFTLAVAVLAWSVGWYESANLWDYLLDPLVAVYAAAALLVQGAGRLRGAR